MYRIFCALVIIVLSFSGASFAQDTTATNTDSSDTTRMRHCPPMGTPMFTMLPRVAANLPDGSILVISGFKLYKYDSDLKLVQEVTIPTDSVSMQKMCPGMGGREYHK